MWPTHFRGKIELTQDSGCFHFFIFLTRYCKFTLCIRFALCHWRHRKWMAEKLTVITVATRNTAISPWKSRIVIAGKWLQVHLPHSNNSAVFLFFFIFRIERKKKNKLSTVFKGNYWFLISFNRVTCTFQQVLRSPLSNWESNVCSSSRRDAIHPE